MDMRDTMDTIPYVHFYIVHFRDDDDMIPADMVTRVTDYDRRFRGILGLSDMH